MPVDPLNPLNVPSNKVIEADTLLERAENKANSFTFFGIAGSKQSNIEEAADMCAKAGNLYKTEKKCKWRLHVSVLTLRREGSRGCVHEVGRLPLSHQRP
jgi:hypothetical protein